MSIHPLAVVSPLAKIGSGVEIGPFCVIEPNVSIGPDCILDSHVIIKSGTELGPRNRVAEGAVLGGMPQHIHVPDKPGKVMIGSGNTIRENVTIHRALDENRSHDYRRQLPDNGQFAYRPRLPSGKQCDSDQ